VPGKVEKCENKKHTNTSVVHPLIVMTPRHALVLHRAHSFIFKVQPSITTDPVSIRIKHFGCIRPAEWRHAVVAKHPMKLVVHRIARKRVPLFLDQHIKRFLAFVSTGET
jgi:hypothetical protein